MKKLAVIIPYFQNDSGILRRALSSILAQESINDVTINIIVVDDGSPAPVEPEIAGLDFSPPFELTVISQANGGVAAARNAGLKQASDEIDYIAFLDSDDIWSAGHISLALKAMNQGYELYFADNKRQGHHDSYFSKCCPKILKFVKQEKDWDSLIPIPNDELVLLILEHFPTQASSVVYNRKTFKDYYFPQTQKFAGEDMIFFASLACRASKICFYPKVMIECGTGINMYFDNIGWDSPKLLPILSDQVRAFNYIRETLQLKPRANKLTQFMLSYYRKIFVFHTIRLFIKRRGVIPPEINLLAKDDKKLPIWFAGYSGYVAIGKLCGTFKPELPPVF